MKSILKQRMGYGLADMGCNLIWQMITLYLMYFYTDVFGLAAAQVSLLFLLTRFVDGITDVLMGMIIDKTKTRWGQSRPYFLIGAIPFALLAILAFNVPDIGEAAKLVYAYITYIGLSCAYTVINVPLSAILPRLTSNAHERTVLVSFRMVFAAIGATIVSSMTMPLVQTFGNGNEAQGFFWTMVIFAVVGMLLFFVTFSTVQERVHVEKSDVTFKEAIKSLKGNTPWFISLFNMVFVFGPLFMILGSMIYYFTYVAENPALVGLLASLISLVPIASSICIPFLTLKLCKRDVMQLGAVLCLIGLFVIAIANSSTLILMIGAAVFAFGTGLRQNMAFAIAADPIDYGEYLSGVNAAGLLSSINGFVVKITLALAGAITSGLLALSGYVAGATQSAEVITSINASFIYIPAVLYIASLVLMSFYKLDAIYPQIRAELDDRIKLKEKNERIES